VQFQCTAGTGVTRYWLDAGTKPGYVDLLNQDAGTNLPMTVTRLPTNGSTIHMRLWSLIGATWQFSINTVRNSDSC
jgi:hypothetical protein